MKVIVKRFFEVTIFMYFRLSAMFFICGTFDFMLNRATDGTQLFFILLTIGSSIFCGLLVAIVEGEEGWK